MFVFIKEMFDVKKVVVVVCYVFWLLIEIGIVKGCKMMLYNFIKIDVINVGVIWEDLFVVVD